MKLQSLSDLEKSIGGRPKTGITKVRMTFYLSEAEATELKRISRSREISVSGMIRNLTCDFLDSVEQ